MIDLHLHTTASDGALSPRDLVARAARAGLTAIAVTDHDTVAGLAEARAAAAPLGVTVVNGIEITAVEDGRDVHVLGYFLDPDDGPLAAFLTAQRADRIRRVQEIGQRLAALGCPVDVAAIVDAAQREGRTVGRPQIADALIAAGHARDRDDAFDRFLGERASAFVPRRGATAADVVRVIARAGGIASLAHPGLTRRDDLIPPLAAAGLAALEVRHSDHDAAAERHYRALARTHGLAVSGGSDFHAETTARGPCLGSVVLSREEFEALAARASSVRRPQ